MSHRKESESTRRLTSAELREKIKALVKTLYGDTNRWTLKLLNESERNLEARYLYGKLKGRPMADKLFLQLSPHESCHLSMLREVLHELVKEQVEEIVEGPKRAGDEDMAMAGESL